jgi:hypothetical protein
VPLDATPLSHIGVLYFGIAGSVYLSTQNTLIQLGLGRQEADTLLASLSALAIDHTHRILRSRRKLDAASFPRGVG